MEEQLSELYKAESELYEAAKEQEQDWPKVFAQYKELYRRFPVQQVAIHFAFFCWYLLWQWDEIVFPGEKPSSQERATLDIRGGISQTELYSSLNRMAGRLLSPVEETEDKYLAILIHMRHIYPYFFESDLLSDELAGQILARLENKQTADPITKRICLYQRDPDITRPSGEEQTDDEIFPSDGSLITHYFQWLFRVNSCLEGN